MAELAAFAAGAAVTRFVGVVATPVVCDAVCVTVDTACFTASETEPVAGFAVWASGACGAVLAPVDCRVVAGGCVCAGAGGCLAVALLLTGFPAFPSCVRSLTGFVTALSTDVAPLGGAVFVTLLRGSPPAASALVASISQSTAAPKKTAKVALKASLPRFPYISLP